MSEGADVGKDDRQSSLAVFAEEVREKRYVLFDEGGRNGSS